MPLRPEPRGQAGPNLNPNPNPEPAPTSSPKVGGYQAFREHPQFVKALDSVFDETHAALVKHGPLTRDKLRAFTILSEEHGEVARATLELTKMLQRYHTNEEAKERNCHLRHELAQVVSVALLMIVNLQEEDY